jgi:hypothetical protein
MDAPSPGFPFRWLLPMLQLLVCIVILQPYWSSLRGQVSRDIQTYWESLLGTKPPRPQPAMVLNVTPESQTQHPVDPRLTAAAALNLPVGALQLPFVFFTADKAEWAPEGMLLTEWRALSWPFVGLIFWWVAGRGLEAFSAAAGSRRFAIIRPPLHRIEVTIGLILFLAGSAAGALYAFDRDPAGLMTDKTFAAGAGLWAVLGSVIVVARLLQWRIRRRARIEGLAYVP